MKTLASSWIGATFKRDCGNWLWVSDGTIFSRAGTIVKGTTAPELVWETSEPNDIGGNESCVEIRNNAKLNDMPCSYKLKYICEHPGTQNLPTRICTSILYMWRNTANDLKLWLWLGIILSDIYHLYFPSLADNNLIGNLYNIFWVARSKRFGFPFWLVGTYYIGKQIIFLTLWLPRIK